VTQCINVDPELLHTWKAANIIKGILLRALGQNVHVLNSPHWSLYYRSEDWLNSDQPQTVLLAELHKRTDVYVERKATWEITPYFKRVVKHTFTSGFPPWSYESNPIRLVCTQPLSQLAVSRRMSNVGENSQRSTTRQTVVTCTEPRSMLVKLSVALWVHW